jgi:2',3'-cyclic-nucleotide 2'-phosphodiesterase/3'-nucleotidase
VNYGSQSLDILRPLIAQWKGTGAATTAETQSSNVPEGVPAVQANSRLNVRTGPSTDHEILGVIGAGSQWTFIREDNGWYVIDYNGREGYIAAQYATRR